MTPSISTRNGELVTILSSLQKFWYRLSSLRWKLFISYIFIGIIPLLFFANNVTETMWTYLSEKQADALRKSAITIADRVSVANYLSDETMRFMFDMYIADKGSELDLRVIVVDASMLVVGDSNLSELGKMLWTPEIVEALNMKSPVRLAFDDTVMYAASPVTDADGNAAGAVLLSAPVDEIHEILREMQRNLVLLTVLLSLVVAVMVFFISQLLIDPLQNILAIVKKMTDGHLNQRVALNGHDEFAALGHAFNDMTAKLDSVETTRQEFVSNVSHELKTPLSSMKVLSEALLLQEDVPNEMYREFLTDITSEVDRMTAIINELLTLVRLDRSEPEMNIKPMKINKMVEDILKRLYPLAESKNIELLFEDVRPIVIDADEMKLSLAVSNLVENGIKYTPEGGTVKVVADADHQNAFITVQDTGIGISEEDQQKVFIRFYRVDKTRDRETGGTGLGLSITHKTVLLHNGSIRVVSKENEGSSFILRLPIHQTGNA